MTEARVHAKRNNLIFSEKKSKFCKGINNFKDGKIPRCVKCMLSCQTVAVVPGKQLKNGWVTRSLAKLLLLCDVNMKYKDILNLKIKIIVIIWNSQTLKALTFQRTRSDMHNKWSKFVTFLHCTGEWTAGTSYIHSKKKKKKSVRGEIPVLFRVPAL